MEMMAMKPIRTIILDQYIWKFIVRILIVTAVVFVYFTDRDFITDFLTQPVFQSLVDRRLWPLVALWGILMVMMATHFIPPKIFTMALLKRKKEKLDMDDSFDKLQITDNTPIFRVKGEKMAVLVAPEICREEVISRFPEICVYCLE